MTSTYLGYKIYANNLSQSLQRVGAETQNANDQKYFEANINKVTSVDGFLNNFRLFNYAMKAYGLQDLGNAQALMRQVLTSDLSDPNSVANRLNDSRYKAFAKAFSFTTTGAVATTGQSQTASQQQDTIAKINPTLATTAGVEAGLSAIKSVADFQKNTGLYAEVLSAYGISANTPKYQVALALESNLSDPNSFANRSDIGSSTTYAKFRALAQDFNFSSNGNLGRQTQLQSAQNITATQTAYMSRIPSDATSQSAAATESAYYAKKMPQLTSVDQIVSDPRLVTYLKTAFQLDKLMTTIQLKSVLTSNLQDPKSAANTLGVASTTTSTSPTANQLIASAFNIGADGTAWDHGTIITTANLAAITKAYSAATTAAAGTNADKITAAQTAAQTETDYVTSVIPTIRSVTGLLADSRVVAYLRTAFNLPAATTTGGTTTANLASILTSNLLDPKSAANTMGASARQLAADFNFAPNGLVYNQRPIQNATNVTATTSAYQALAGTTAGAKAASQTETDYYTSTIGRVKSVDDLTGNKRLVAYLAKAFNITDTTPSTLRQVLTSNLLDTKSKANVLGGGYQKLAAAFDVSAEGTIAHPADQAVQTKTGLAATHSAFLEQAMETEAGAQNDGVRLALYFHNLAPTITNAYQILADKALTKVVQTMLGLSASSSNADIDAQARNITNRLNLADLKDPQKLEKLVANFAALYDLTNASGTSGGSTTSSSG